MFIKIYTRTNTQMTCSKIDFEKSDHKREAMAMSQFIPPFLLTFFELQLKLNIKSLKSVLKAKSMLSHFGKPFDIW